MKTFAKFRLVRRCAVCTTALACLFLSGTASAQAPAAADDAPKAWTGTAGLGISVTSGNSDTMNYNAAFDITRTPKARNVMKFTGLYLRGEQNTVTVVNRTSLAYRDEYAWSGRTYVFGQLEYLRDTFKLIDYLYAPTAGLGFNVSNTDATKFTVFGGAGSVTEKNPGRARHTSAALTAGEKLQQQLTPTATFKHASTALWNAGDFADGLYTTSFGISAKLSDRMQLALDLLDTYKNRPASATTKKNDVALVTAITAKF